MNTNLIKITFIVALGLICSKADAYPVAQIKNNTEYTVKGTVHYPGCSNDNYTVKPGKTWKASSRGVCLITKITGKLSGTPASLRAAGIQTAGERRLVTTYKSSGTGFAKFQINAFGDRYRIFSLQEWEKVSNAGKGKSPGFRMVNYTPWPIAVSFDQVGCLYYGIVPAMFNGKAGEFRRDTGAVWFTIRAHIQPNGMNSQTDLDCARPVAEIVGDVAMGVLSGGTVAATKVALKQAVKTALKESVKSLAEVGAAELGRYLTDTSSIELYGQYAGYAWPFQCREMPEYHISGGPTPVIDEYGEVYLSAGEPFMLKKVNSCGNDMMPASSKSASLAVKPLSGYINSGGQPQVAMDHRYTVIIDCNHKDLDSEGTKGRVTVSLISQNKTLDSKYSNAPVCSGSGKLQFELSTKLPIVEKINIATNSDNAFFIDAVTIKYDGVVAKQHGKNNGRGWCLSVDANDVNGSWRNHVSSCKREHVYALF